jgi:hypothetical protein
MKHNKQDIQNQMRKAVTNPSGIPIPNIEGLNVTIDPHPVWIPMDRIKAPFTYVGKKIVVRNPGRYRDIKPANVQKLLESFIQQGFIKELGIGTFEPVIEPNGKDLSYNPVDSFTRLAFEGPDQLDLDGVIGWRTNPNLSMIDKGILSLRLNPDMDPNIPNKSVKADFVSLGVALYDDGQLGKTDKCVSDFVERACMSPDNVNPNIRTPKFKNGVINAILTRIGIGNIGNSALYKSDSMMNDFMRTYNIYDDYHTRSNTHLKVIGYKTKPHLTSASPLYDYSWVRLRGNDHQSIVLMDALSRTRNRERMEKFGRTHTTRLLVDVEVSQKKNIMMCRDEHYDKMNSFVKNLRLDSNNQITFHWVQEGMLPQDARFDTIMNQVLWTKKFNPNQ